MYRFRSQIKQSIHVFLINILEAIFCHEHPVDKKKVKKRQLLNLWFHIKNVNFFMA